MGAKKTTLSKLSCDGVMLMKAKANNSMISTISLANTKSLLDTNPPLSKYQSMDLLRNLVAQSYILYRLNQCVAPIKSENSISKKTSFPYIEQSVIFIVFFYGS